MLDYLPLIVTFVLALVGLVMRTTHDPPKTSLIKRLTPPGWAVLALLLLALGVGSVNTYKRRAADRASNQINLEKRFRDSTTWATSRAVQDTVLREARSAAIAQIMLLDSSLVASRKLTDSLRKQGIEFRENLLAQQALLQSEADRLRNGIATPRVSLTIAFPTLEQARRWALTRLERRPETDSLRDSANSIISGAELRRDRILSGGREVPFPFPLSFYAEMWPSVNGDCDWQRWPRPRPVLAMHIPSVSPQQWSDYWIDSQGQLHVMLNWTLATIERSGVASLSELRDGCFEIAPDFDPPPEWLAATWDGDVLGLLFEGLWGGSRAVSVTFDFGDGRVLTSPAQREALWPLQARVPKVLPWEAR